MPRPKPDEPQKIISVQVRAAADERVRQEAARAGVTVSAMYRELFRLGLAAYRRSGA
ncbi:hypothetical protein [Jiangella asiatica]|uniref:hypothetical protein n=1 Tax=Jiangella asiatica TaxID=2530372 RepID=UPI0013A5C998|nr:hypothetical protein [Jiangella asiatica]